MGLLKKFLVLVCNVILLLCVFLGTLSFTTTKIVKEGVSSVIDSKLSSLPAYGELGLDSEKLIEFVEKEEVREFALGYINPLLGEEIDVNNVNIGKDILVFVQEHKTELEEITGQNIEISKVEELANSQEMTELNSKYVDMVTETSGMVPVEVKDMVYTYGFFFTDSFRQIMLIAGVISIVLVILLEKSIHKWMKGVGGTLVGCGVLMFVALLVCSTVITQVFKLMNLEVISFDFKNVYICSGVIFILGIVLICIYNSLEKRERERSILNELSTISK